MSVFSGQWFLSQPPQLKVFTPLLLLQRLPNSVRLDFWSIKNKASASSSQQRVPYTSLTYISRSLTSLSQINTIANLASFGTHQKNLTISYHQSTPPHTHTPIHKLYSLALIQPASSDNFRRQTLLKAQSGSPNGIYIRSTIVFLGPRVYDIFPTLYHHFRQTQALYSTQTLSSPCDESSYQISSILPLKQSPTWQMSSSKTG